LISPQTSTPQSDRKKSCLKGYLNSSTFAIIIDTYSAEMVVNMAAATAGYTPLYIALGVLMLDALLEVSFVGSMVGFLHDRAGKFFTINTPQGPFRLHGKPKGLLVDQGHTSNGAAGTALILVGVLGLLVIWHDKRRARKVSLSNPNSHDF
jgi:hypothetical protein